jgi:ubiquinol-cytochrome c reductase iron-sulfur subunit
MVPLANASRAITRAVPRCCSASTARALSTTAVRSDSAASYQSPFKGESRARNIPDFSKYMSKGSGERNLVFQYFMVGTMGALTAASAKSTVHGEC